MSANTDTELNNVIKIPSVSTIFAEGWFYIDFVKMDKGKINERRANRGDQKDGAFRSVLGGTARRIDGILCVLTFTIQSRST